MKDNNLLNRIPSLRKNVTHQNGELLILREGVFSSFFITLFNLPRTVRLDLDDLGENVILLMDGKRTILEISKEIHTKFGEKAEPLIPRLVEFIRILTRNKLIHLNQRK